jgi:P pilus assembly protein, chaperone PapD
MLLILRNRIKIFYRPEVIGNPHDILSDLKVKYLNGVVEVNNDQPWHVSIVDVSVKARNGTISCMADMIAPYSTKKYECKGNIVRSYGDIVVSISAMNDQGAKVSENYPNSVR